MTEPFDMTVPDPARRYNALLGGKDNFRADRLSATELSEAYPAITIAAVENRRFVRRAVHFLAADRHIDQFIDIGCGYPDAPNVHEVAQAVNPACRIVYVDHDSVVAVHARALMRGTAQGAVSVVVGDLRQPAGILADPELTGILDLTRPVGLILAAVLHFLPDDEHPHTAVQVLLDALPPGSFVVLSHATYDPIPAPQRQRLAEMAEPGAGHGPFQARSRDEVNAFINGLTPVKPGLVSTVHWRPELPPPASWDGEEEAMCYAAVAEKR